MPRGRPKVKQEIILEALTLVSGGLSIREACKKAGIDYSTFYQKVALPEYTNQYARALEIRADVLFDQIIDIADNPDQDADVQRDRLRVDARKWVVSKMLPKKYGDKTSVEIDDAAANLAAIIKQALGQ